MQLYEGNDFKSLEKKWTKKLFEIAKNNFQELKQMLTKPKDFRQFEKSLARLVSKTYNTFPILKETETTTEQSRDTQAKNTRRTESKKSSTKKSTQLPFETNTTQNNSLQSDLLITPKRSKKSKKSTNQTPNLE